MHALPKRSSAVLLSEEAGQENCERITRDDLVVIGPLTPIQNRQHVHVRTTPPHASIRRQCCPRRGGGGCCHLSLRLTMPHDVRPTAAPQTRNERPFPWSGRFDRIFRNEKAAGSNPASSTLQQSGYPDSCHFATGWSEAAPPSETATLSRRGRRHRGRLPWSVDGTGLTG